MVKIWIFIPAYNCEHSIAKVVARIPQSLWRQLTGVLIIDDASTDHTWAVLRSLRRAKIHILHNSTNLKYAGNQKKAYAWLLKRGVDIVVMLHDDGQYAPEEMGRLLEPLKNNQADVVQGSRMLSGGALKGGMPISKYLGNIILGQIENLVVGMDLAEFHSGYMAYNRRALKIIPFARLGDSFHFDGEMLFMAHKRNLRVKEVPISSNFRGDARSYLKPLRYLQDWTKIMWKYKTGGYDF